MAFALQNEFEEEATAKYQGQGGQIAPIKPAFDKRHCVHGPITNEITWS